jgi:hypothetical protein
MGRAVLDEAPPRDASFPGPTRASPPRRSVCHRMRAHRRGPSPEIVPGDAGPRKPWSPGTIAPLDDGEARPAADQPRTAGGPARLVGQGPLEELRTATLARSAPSRAPAGEPGPAGFGQART